MTTIACWFNKESEHTSIWVCGDSKVSSSNSSTLIESSPKIFALPVRCFVPGKEGFFDLPNFNGTIGVAYAGNSLIGLTLNSALATCLGHLISYESPPALDDIAKFTLEMLHMYVRELGATSGDRALCEVAIVGYCLAEGQHKMYHLSPIIQTGELKYQLNSYSANQADDFVLLLGADKERIKEAINELRQPIDKDISWWRAPKSVISTEVKNPNHPTIGGHLQMGIGNALGFQVYSVCQPYGVGPAAYLSYLGLNVSSSFGQIGVCKIGMPGMV
jgi:hypothetical protein